MSTSPGVSVELGCLGLGLGSLTPGPSGANALPGEYQKHPSCIPGLSFSICALRSLTQLVSHAPSHCSRLNALVFLFVLVWLLQGGLEEVSWVGDPFRWRVGGVGRESEVLVASDEGSERHKGHSGPFQDIELLGTNNSVSFQRAVTGGPQIIVHGWIQTQVGLVWTTQYKGGKLGASTHTVPDFPLLLEDLAAIAWHSAAEPSLNLATVPTTPYCLSNVQFVYLSLCLLYCLFLLLC